LPGFDWTDEDVLAANAAGRVAPAQRALLVGSPERMHLFGIGLQLVTVAVGGALLLSGHVPAAITVLLVGSNVAVVLIGVGWGQRRSRADLITHVDSPRIDSGIGQIVSLPGGGYEARVGADRLSCAGGGAPLPPPGWYRLYWLASTAYEGADRWLLSVSPQPLPGSPDLVRDAVMAGLGCTEQELASNRTGALAPRQRRTLLRGIRARVGAGLLLLALTGAGWAALGPRVGQRLAGSPPAAALAALGCLLTVTGAVLLAVVVMARTGRRLRRVLRQGRPVATLRGSASVERVHDELYRLHIHGHRFPLDENAARAFTWPGRYAAHYLPALDRLLSAEPLPDGD